MIHSFSEANISTILDACLSASDESHLLHQIETVYDTIFGLDFVVDDQRRTLLHILAAMPDKFTYWNTILNGFVYLDMTDSALQTPLHVAIASRNIPAIRALVEHGASPTVEDEHGVNPIHLACQSNYREALAVLLTSFSTVRYISENTMRVCHVCTENGALDAFKLVIGSLQPKALDRVDEEGYALIHHLVIGGNIEFLEFLLGRGVDIDKKVTVDKVERTPLELATKLEVAKLLFARKASYNKKQPTPIIAECVKMANEWPTTGQCLGPTELHEAAMSGNCDVIRKFLGKTVDVVDASKMTPLFFAISSKQTPVIQALLERNANPNFNTGLSTGFLFAALKGSTEQLKAMVAGGKSPDLTMVDSEGRDLLMCSVQSRNPECVEFVVSLNAGIGANLPAILKFLVEMEDDYIGARMITALVKAGFPVDATTGSGKSLLKIVIDENKFMMAKALLDAGALKALPENECADCLINAVLGEKPIVEDLLQVGADPEGTKHGGRPLILHTANHKGGEIRKLLVDSRPESDKARLVNAVDTMGNTLLHCGAHAGNPVTIDDAINTYHIGVDEKNMSGETALMVLMHTESDAFQQNFEVLVNAGANIRTRDNRMKNILHACVDSHNEKALKFLVEQYLSEDQLTQMLDEQDNNSNTPAVLASRKSDTRCAKVLSAKRQMPIFNQPLTMEAIEAHVAAGFSPNVCNSQGDTLILCAMKTIYEQDQALAVRLVTRLVELGADPSEPDAEGLGPLHHAIRLGSVDLAKFLVEKGANFIVTPVIYIYAMETCDQPEIGAIVKQPEKRASSIEEILNTQVNAAETLRCMLKFNDRFGNNPFISDYMHDVKLMQRVLAQFVQRLERLFAKLKPSTEIGNFLLYFADAFLPLLGMAASYEVAVAEINNDPTYAQIQTEPTGFQNLTLNDSLIVPTQQFTRYGSLIEAVIKATPEDHPDMPALKKAMTKYNYIGRTSNERKLIAESQKELRAIKLIANINDQMTRVWVDDILFNKGQFEKKSFTKPTSVDKLPKKESESAEWGLRIIEQKTGQLTVMYFTAFGSSMDSFLSKAKIAILLFRKSILFGVQKTADKFKLKFSCRSSEVLWDFGREHGQDSLMLYTPFGKLFLKIAPAKNTDAKFERNRWKLDVDKQVNSLDGDDDQSPGGAEVVYVSWVGETTGCVHSQLFHVLCSTKEEAKQKILAKLAELGVAILKKNDPVQGPVPLINFDFQTLKKNEGQESDVISDIFD